MTVATIAALLLAGAQATPPPPPACERVPGIELVTRAASERRFIVMGEVHGTVQAPRLFAALVCHVLRTKPVTVMLEFRADAQPALAAYLASDGSAAARAAFLAHELWDPRYADGRNSAAMFDLVEALRRLKRGGAAIEVFATQPTTRQLRPQFYGELGRAADWSQLAATRPDAVNLILVGTAHAALRDNAELDFLPAAAHLRAVDVLAIGPTDEGGTRWGMTLSPEGKPVVGAERMDGSPKMPGIAALPDATTGWNATYAFGEAARPSRPRGEPR